MSAIRYYQYITDLPLRHFITCAVDGNLSALTIEGHPTPEQLYIAWVGIQQQYADAIGDMESKVYWGLYKEVSELHNNINAINPVAEQMVEWQEALCDLPMTYNEQQDVLLFLKECGEVLNRITSSAFQYDPSSTKFTEEINKAIRKGKALNIQYQLKSSQLEAMQAKAEKGDKPTKEYYIGLLMTLSKGEGYKLTIDSETVYEFCERIRRYQKAAQWQTKNG